MLSGMQQLVRHTRVQKIVGDVIRLNATGVRLGDMAEDAFDDVDACMLREPQLESLRLIKNFVDRDCAFPDRDQARELFTKVIGLYKNWNYSPPGSPEFQKYKTEIEQAARQQAFGGP